MSTKNEKNQILAALDEESDEIYFKPRQVTKTPKREPVVKDKFKKPVRNDNKRNWE